MAVNNGAREAASGASGWQAVMRWALALGLLVVSAGVGGWGFGWLLAWVTTTREHQPWLPWLLPVVGAALLFGYRRLGDVAQGTRRVVAALTADATNAPMVPPLMAPAVVLATCTTHLVGGSAGREGTALQLGAALGQGIAMLTRLPSQDLIRAGCAAGFAAVFGTPWAAACFAFEFVPTRPWHRTPLVLAAALGGHWMAGQLGVAHAHLPQVAWQGSVHIGVGMLALAVMLGLMVRSFLRLVALVRRTLGRLLAKPWQQAALGGVAVLGLWQLVLPLHGARYLGLGVPSIVAAFASPAQLYDAPLKLLFTAVTLGAGFIGGEVTPLFFMGATLGSAWAGATALPLALFAAVGLVGGFAAAARTPIAMTVMAVELFGWPVAPYALGVASVACFVAGRPGLYHSH